MSAPSFADDRIAARFALLKKKARPGLVTFITANDPTPDVFREILEGLREAVEQLVFSHLPHDLSHLFAKAGIPTNERQLPSKRGDDRARLG